MDDEELQRKPSENDIKSLINASGIYTYMSPIQSYSFHLNLDSEQYKLMQLPHEVFEQLQVGDSVKFRGKSEDDGIICTNDTTYEIKVADTSNILLLTPRLFTPEDEQFKNSEESVASADVVACLQEIYELRECRPRVERIQLLLEENLYSGPEPSITELNLYNEGNGTSLQKNQLSTNRKYTYSDLLKLVQASSQQIMAFLCEIEAIEIDGYWRLLEEGYRDSIVLQILNLLDEKGWSYTYIPISECCDVLKELYEPNILEHVLGIFADKIDNEICKLKEDEICRFYAEYLLKGVKKFALEEFLGLWQQSVPEGMTTNPDHLDQFSIRDYTSTPHSIWYLATSKLPWDPYQRIVQLFSEKTKWRKEELVPFLQPLATKSLTIESMLIKYTRSETNKKNEKLYVFKKKL